MKKQLLLFILFRIIILFTIPMLFTFIPEHIRWFFGDVPYSDGLRHGSDFMEDGYDWGSRHYWYAWMCFFLFLTSIVDTVISIIKMIEKYYDTEKW